VVGAPDDGVSVNAGETVEVEDGFAGFDAGVPGGGLAGVGGTIIAEGAAGWGSSGSRGICPRNATAETANDNSRHRCHEDLKGKTTTISLHNVVREGAKVNLRAAITYSIFQVRELAPDPQTSASEKVSLWPDRKRSAKIRMPPDPCFG